MDSSVPLVSLETLNQTFEQASKRAASMNVPNESRLDLYGLYKQATQGDCSTKEPSRFNVIEHAKWSAWKKLSGTTDSAAKHAYTELVKKLDPTFDPALKQNDDKQQADAAAEDDQEKVIKIVLEESKNPETEPARVLIQEDVEDETKPPVTVASVEVPANSTPVNIALETVPSTQQTSQLNRALGGLGRPGGHDSPVPTWAVFLLGVLFLCFLDDNISFGNMIMNGLGVSVLTAAIISLQMK